MSRIPFYITNYRTGQKFGNGKLVDGLFYDGLTNVYDGTLMGVCAEKTAKDYNISKKD